MKSFKHFHLALVFLASSLLSVNIFAQDTDTNQQPLMEKRYVSDILYVPMRSGAGNKYRVVHRGLKSGTAVTVLTDDGNGWSQVKTSKGKEGWMPTSYLLKKPTSSIYLKQAQKTIDQLSSKAGPLSEQLLNQQKENQTLTQQLEALKKDNNLLQKELERIKGLSSNAIELNKSNIALLQDNEKLKHEHDTLQAENTRLSNKLTSDDFMYGVLTVILGMIVTLIIQYFTRTRRRSEWG